MRKLATVLAAPLAAALSIGTAYAGVVLHEDELFNSPFVRGSVTKRVISVEGNKAEILGQSQINRMVVDLDSNKTLIIHPGAKDYFQSQFPSRGTMGAAIVEELTPPLLNFKKTGKSKTLIGYKCDEYKASGDAGEIHYISVSACYSTDAPGAKDFTAFVKSAVVKLASAQHAKTAFAIPEGVPLEMRTEILTNLPTPLNLKPSPKFPLPKFMAAIPTATKTPTPVPTPAAPAISSETTTTTVTQIEFKPIPADRFVPPAGFTAKSPKIIGY